MCSVEESGLQRPQNGVQKNGAMRFHDPKLSTSLGQGLSPPPGKACFSLSSQTLGSILMPLERGAASNSGDLLGVGTGWSISSLDAAFPGSGALLHSQWGQAAVH